MVVKDESKKSCNAVLGFEAKLWLAADELRIDIGAAEYKHVVLGLILLKYVSDTLERHRAKLLPAKGKYACANSEYKNAYKGENVFSVLKEARWSHLQANANQLRIGALVDHVMVAIERDNPRLKVLLSKDNWPTALEKHRMGELNDLIGTSRLAGTSASKEVAKANRPRYAWDGNAEGKVETKTLPSHRSVDLLGRFFKYLLTQFSRMRKLVTSEMTLLPKCSQRTRSKCQCWWSFRSRWKNNSPWFPVSAGSNRVLLGSVGDASEGSRHPPSTTAIGDVGLWQLLTPARIP